LPFFFWISTLLHRCIVSICKCQTSSLLPSIYPLPSPFLLPPSSFQNTHARRFERAKSIERCQRARGLEDSRDVSDRTLFFLPSSFLIFLYSLLLFSFFFYVVVASQKRPGKDELLEKRSRRKEEEVWGHIQDVCEREREERLCVCAVLCHSRRRNGCDLFIFP
jgi:hypothetical protein